MILYCKKHNYYFQILVHDQIQHIGLIFKIYLNKDKNPIIEKINNFHKNETSNILDYIDNSRYVIELAQIIPDEIHLLELFKHVIFIDITEKTNNDKQPLLPAGFNDSFGKNIIFFMPNQ